MEISDIFVVFLGLEEVAEESRVSLFVESFFGQTPFGCWRLLDDVHDRLELVLSFEGGASRDSVFLMQRQFGALFRRFLITFGLPRLELDPARDFR